jgi:hypothetical protein
MNLIHGRGTRRPHPRQRGEQRVLNAGVAGEQRQMNQLVFRHGFVGMDDERERFAGFFHRVAQMEVNCASLTIWFAK